MLYASGLHGDNSLSDENELGHPSPDDAAHNRPRVQADAQLHRLSSVRHHHGGRGLQHGLGKLEDRACMTMRHI